MPSQPERGRLDSIPPPSANMKTHIVEAEPRTVRRKAVFTVSGGLDAGRVIPIPRSDVISFGRAAECSYPFDDVSLSREHAQVMCIGADCVFKDTGSTNGSFINEERVTRPTVLRN